MRTSSYKDFSLKFHKKNWRNRKTNLCHFELTFGCALHCKHCYSDCYNKASYIKKELSTSGVRLILDKLYDESILWLCFTGGDPLTRSDFLELYAHAKDKGFIIILFTNAYSMNERIAEYLKNRPPFVIEITLNAVTREVYDSIAQVKGAYNKTMQGIDLILKSGLPLRIKTQITKDNLTRVPKIKQFIKKLGLKFYPAPFLHSRLNGDSSPTDLRISPQEFLSLNGDVKEMPDDSCDSSLGCERGAIERQLFPCAITGGGGIRIDPYGNVVPCNCIRKPSLNLLKRNLRQAQEEILGWARTRNFTKNSQCRNCSIRDICFSCPGKALLEISDMEAPVPYFCQLAHLSLDNYGVTQTTHQSNEE